MNEEDFKILVDDIQDFLNGVEVSCVKLRKQLEKLIGPKTNATVLENRFNILKWQNEKGEKLGDFQVAYQSHNLPENWNHAYNILKANNCLIANPFHEEGFAYRYWIYPKKYKDRIFRKKLGEAKP